MSIFVVESCHTSDQCPMTSSKVREFVTSDPGKLPKMMQEHGVRLIAGPYVSMSHRGFTVVEASTVDVVRDVVVKSGLAQWNSVEIIPVQTQEEGLRQIAELKPLY